MGGQVQTRDHPLAYWTGFFNPLLLMQGSLGSGEGSAEQKPKTLSELRKELFKVDKKEEDGHESDVREEASVQAKHELSSWNVDAGGNLQTSPAPSAILRARDRRSSTPVRFESRSQHHTRAYSGTTLGTSPPF